MTNQDKLNFCIQYTLNAINTPGLRPLLRFKGHGTEYVGKLHHMHFTLVNPDTLKENPLVEVILDFNQGDNILTTTLNELDSVEYYETKSNAK